MSSMRDDLQGIKDDAKDKLTSDLAELKASFGKLRSDVMTLLNDAMSAGKQMGSTGAAAAQEKATTAYHTAQDKATAAMDSVKDRVSDLKERGNEHVEKLSHKIEDNPVAAALIALGVGFVVAKLFTRK